MCLWSEQDNHNVALRKKVHEKSPWQLLDDGTIDRSAFPVLNLCFCVRFVGSWQTSLAASSPSLPAAARSFPSLTGHLHEAGQPPVGVVHQQDAVLAQLHASQKQHHHLFKLVLLYAACGGARPPRHRGNQGPPLPAPGDPGCSPSNDSSQRTAQPASAISTSVG